VVWGFSSNNRSIKHLACKSSMRSFIAVLQASNLITRVNDILKLREKVSPVYRGMLRSGLEIGGYSHVAPLPAIPRLSALVRDATQKEFQGEWRRCRIRGQGSGGIQDPMEQLTCHRVKTVP
jgi:hypothetical protein